MTDWDPCPSPYPSLQMREKRREGANAQEWGAPGLGDLLQEGESPLHWALIIHRAGHQKELQCCRGPSLWSRVEDQHALLIPLRPNKRLSENLVGFRKCAAGVGSEGALSGEEQMVDTFPGLLQPNWSGTCRRQC